MIKSPAQTSWTAVPGFLILVPVKLPEKTEAGVLIPDSATTKTNSGVCVKVGRDPDICRVGETVKEEHFIGKEIYFNRHDEYSVIDSDTGQLFYILHESKIILWRNPPQYTPFFPIAHSQGSEAGVGQIRKESSDA